MGENSLESDTHDSWGPGEVGVSTRVDLFSKRWQMVTLSIILGFAFVIVFLKYGLPVYSDDGVETGENAFESPLLIWKYPLGDEASLAGSERAPGDLLTNGNMDQMGFYWRPPNHWIAGGWFEWFSTMPFHFPEFNDGFERGFSHTYPSSQRLQLWGSDYAGGLMQSVTVTPCTYYRLEAFGQSRPGSDDPPPVDVDSQMKVGIEPYGWMSGRSIPDYDPGLEPDEFPETVVWSAEATHNFYYAPYSVTVEALSSTVTAILFSHPQIDVRKGILWNDALWDTASLVQVSPPSGTLLEGDFLPEPDGLITNVSATVLPRIAIVEWDTTVDASTQLQYRIWEPITPITLTIELSYSLHLPLVVSAPSLSSLNLASPPDQTPRRHHQVVLTGLPESYAIDFVALSRRLDGNACLTSASKVIHAESQGEVYFTYIPVLMKGD